MVPSRSRFFPSVDIFWTTVDCRCVLLPFQVITNLFQLLTAFGPVLPAVQDVPDLLSHLTYFSPVLTVVLLSFQVVLSRSRLNPAFDRFWPSVDCHPSASPNRSKLFQTVFRYNPTFDRFKLSVDYYPFPFRNCSKSFQTVSRLKPTFDSFQQSWPPWHTILLPFQTVSSHSEQFPNLFLLSRDLSPVLTAILMPLQTVPTRSKQYPDFIPTFDRCVVRHPSAFPNCSKMFQINSHFCQISAQYWLPSFCLSKPL